MDVDLQVEDLTGSEADDEETSGGEVVSSPLGSSSDLRSSRSSFMTMTASPFCLSLLLMLMEIPLRMSSCYQSVVWFWQCFQGPLS